MHAVMIDRASAKGVAHDSGSELNREIIRWLMLHSGPRVASNAAHVPERYWTLRTWRYHHNPKDRDLMLEFSHKHTAALFKLTWL